MKLRNVISSIILILYFVSKIIIGVFCNSYNSSVPNDYAIVFDAGSSVSKMYIYQWQGGYSKGDSLLVTQIASCETDDDGLDKVKSKQDLINKYLNCINKAKDIIPNDRKNKTYLFLGATAGMRLLNFRNKTLSDEIIGYVRDYFSSLNFLFKSKNQARIISGKEEGTNAWISANYFLNNFNTRLDTFNKNKPFTKGLLDLGGASTQIVYVTEKLNPKYKEFFSNITINKINYQLYSHSFLCWGIHEISLLYYTLIIKKNHYKEFLTASCLPLGSNFKLQSESILSSPCASGQVFNKNYNFMVDSLKIKSKSSFNFKGSSNKTQCEVEIAVLLPNRTCFYENSCLFDNFYLPNVSNLDFLAFSNYYFAFNKTAKLLNINIEDLDWDKFKNATNFICSSSLAELNELNLKNKANINEIFLINQCFSNIYILTLLSRYGFTDFTNFNVTYKVNGSNLTWALGYLINELNRDDFLPFEEPT